MISLYECCVCNFKYNAKLKTCPRCGSYKSECEDMRIVFTNGDDNTLDKSYSTKKGPQSKKAGE